uniref:Uncharacterized protein n=1 Tax=Arundo donax TaxID=35708 RepID=A0A0A9F077_ARUDO
MTCQKYLGSGHVIVQAPYPV